MKFSCCSIWRWSSGIVFVARVQQRLGLSHVEDPGDAAVQPGLTSSSDCFLEATVRLEISSVRSRARRVR